MTITNNIYQVGGKKRQAEEENTLPPPSPPPDKTNMHWPSAAFVSARKERDESASYRTANKEHLHIQTPARATP